jgi:predicted DNA-binding transcriptional regulator
MHKRKMVEDYLSKLGLNKKEISIYLFSLEFGPESISGISKKLELERTGLYPCIERLIAHGLLFEIAKGKRSVFRAAHPSAVVGIVKYKQQELSKLDNLGDRFVAELSQIGVEGAKSPKIEFHEVGTKKIDKAFLSALEGYSGKVYYIGNIFLPVVVISETLLPCWISSNIRSNTYDFFITKDLNISEHPIDSGMVVFGDWVFCEGGYSIKDMGLAKNLHSIISSIAG